MKYYNLTTPQKNIWNLQQYYSDTSISNLCGAIFYGEKRDEKLLEKAVNHIIYANTGLRLQLDEIDGEAVQYIAEYEYEQIPVRSFTNYIEYRHYVKTIASKRMELNNSKLYRFEIIDINGQSGIICMLNHIIADAWTYSLVAKGVDKAYQELLSGVEGDSVNNDYVDFINSEQKYRVSPKYIKDEEYWKDKYDGKTELSSVKMYTFPPKTIRAERIIKRLDQNLTSDIKKYCHNNLLSPAVFFETVINIYLSKINNENKTITIGVPILNRSNAKEKNMTGMFISTMPLTIDISQEESVSDICKKLTTAHMELFRHQKYPYSEILKNIRDRQELSGNLYDVMVSYQNAQTDLDSYTEWYSTGYSEVPLAIHIDDRDGGNDYTLTVDYQTEVFRQSEEIELIIKRLENIIEQVLRSNYKKVRDISILTENETDKLLLDFNDTAVDYPRDKCVHELFEEQVQRTPDKIALVFEDKEFTYKQLDEMSNSLAHLLREKGVGKGDKVAVLLNRDEKVIMLQLAILKLRAVFIPIDSRYPKDRIEYILNESNAKLIIKNREIEFASSISLDIENGNIHSVKQFDNIEVNPKDVCYIIFTSVSTGKPKGCTLTNSGLVNFCINNNILEECNKLDRQVCVSVNTISFDFFIAESLLPLLNGYTVVLANEEESTSQEKFAELVVKNKVNIIQTTPTRHKIYFNENKNLSYAKQFEIIVTSGEALPVDLLKVFNKFSSAKVFNPLGPSECSVWVAGGELKLKNECVTADDITIGKPIANTQIYILDSQQHLLPIGVAGELCIAGDGVGKGYLNRPELTAERFIPNPFATEENGHGKVMYRTGDLARWRADGEIEYLGRIDTQVKIRGLRIELGEIESVMSSFAGIQLAAVTDKKDENNRQYLVAYYTADKELDEKALRAHLSAKLPKYMVPNYFMRLDEMPMTPSGKTDRKNLPVPDFAVSDREYVAPETDDEVILCELYKQILKNSNIGVEDDFFECGGDSLGAIELVAKAHDKGIEIALQNVFDYPTVRELCAFIEKGEKTNIHYEAEDFEKYDKLLNRNVIDESFVPVRKSLGNVLLTGATGFLGAHILDTLLREETGKIYCLIRSNSEDDRRGRLFELIEYYFGDKYRDEYGRRIIPIIGNIENSNLSEDMPSDVQTVIHTAASVKHYGSYEYFRRVNVEGTQNVISYARRMQAKLIHISTLSVSGNSMADDFSVYRSEDERHFYETTLYMEQPLDNVYVHSKFDAERAVLDAMLDGLNARIIRVGNLTNRMSDYKFQPNYRENAFLTRVRALLEFGKFPNYLMDLYAEFSPIDKTAEGVVRIAQYADRQCVFHLNSNKPIYFERFAQILQNMNISMQIVDGKEFAKALSDTMKQTSTEYIFEAFQNDMNEQGELVYDSNIRIENDFTVWFMKKVGFEWTDIDEEYISGYLNYFRELGYLEV